MDQTAEHRKNPTLLKKSDILTDIEILLIKEQQFRITLIISKHFVKFYHYIAF